MTSPIATPSLSRWTRRLLGRRPLAAAAILASATSLAGCAGGAMEFSAQERQALHDVAAYRARIDAEAEAATKPINQPIAQPIVTSRGQSEQLTGGAYAGSSGDAYFDAEAAAPTKKKGLFRRLIGGVRSDYRPAGGYGEYGLATEAEARAAGLIDEQSGVASIRRGLTQPSPQGSDAGRVAIGPRKPGAEAAVVTIELDGEIRDDQVRTAAAGRTDRGGIRQTAGEAAAQAAPLPKLKNYGELFAGLPSTPKTRPQSTPAVPGESRLSAGFASELAALRDEVVSEEQAERAAFADAMGGLGDEPADVSEPAAKPLQTAAAEPFGDEQFGDASTATAPPAATPDADEDNPFADFFNAMAAEDYVDSADGSETAEAEAVAQAGAPAEAELVAETVNAEPAEPAAMFPADATPDAIQTEESDEFFAGPAESTPPAAPIRSPQVTTGPTLIAAAEPAGTVEPPRPAVPSNVTVTPQRQPWSLPAPAGLVAEATPQSTPQAIGQTAAPSFVPGADPFGVSRSMSVWRPHPDADPSAASRPSAAPSPEEAFAAAVQRGEIAAPQTAPATAPTPADRSEVNEFTASAGRFGWDGQSVPLRTANLPSAAVARPLTPARPVGQSSGGPTLPSFDFAPANRSADRSAIPAAAPAPPQESTDDFAAFMASATTQQTAQPQQTTQPQQTAPPQLATQPTTIEAPAEGLPSLPGWEESEATAGRHDDAADRAVYSDLVPGEETETYETAFEAPAESVQAATSGRSIFGFVMTGVLAMLAFIAFRSKPAEV